MEYTFDPEGHKIQEVGSLRKEIIDMLGLELEERKVLISAGNIKHMKKEHPKDYEKYGQLIPKIIAYPDYVGIHPKNGSIQYIKEVSNGILIAVRASSSGVLFVRSLYELSEGKLELYIKSGTIKKAK